MKDLLRRILSVAETEGAKRVTGVSVWLGAFSHMSPEHFAEHFIEASAGTIAEGARIDTIVSDDMNDANAQRVLLDSVEVEN